MVLQPGKNHRFSISSIFEFFLCQKHVIHQKYCFCMICNIFPDTLCFYFGQNGPESKNSHRDPTETNSPYGGKTRVYTRFFRIFRSQRVFHATKTYQIDLESWNKYSRHFISRIYLFFRKIHTQNGVFPRLSDFRYFGYFSTFFHFSQPIFIILR